jgi:hypothetical protein
MRLEGISIPFAEPPGPLYPSIRYFRLVLKYVPSTQAFWTPEMWLVTYNPYSNESVRPYLRGAFRLPDSDEA